MKCPGCGFEDDSLLSELSEAARDAYIQSEGLWGLVVVSLGPDREGALRPLRKLREVSEVELLRRIDERQAAVGGAAVEVDFFEGLLRDYGLTVERQRILIIEATGIAEVDALPGHVQMRVLHLVHAARELTQLTLVSLWFPFMFLRIVIAAPRRAWQSRALLRENPSIRAAEIAARRVPRKDATIELAALRDFSQARIAFLILPFVPVGLFSFLGWIVVHYGGH